MTMRLTALVAASMLIMASAVRASASEIDLRDASFDYSYIIIAHDSLLSAVQPLKEHRENDYCGNFSNVHSVVAIARSTVEAQFGEGPSGIKEFLTYAYKNWAAEPEYVLLVGDADYVEAFRDTLIPTHSCRGQDQRDFRTDDWFACVDGPFDIVPEMVVARLPARTATEVEAYVDKVIAYDVGGVSRAANDNILFLCQDCQCDNPSLAQMVTDDLTGNFLCNECNILTLRASEICGGSPDCYAYWEAAALEKLNASPSGEAPTLVGGIGGLTGAFGFMAFLEITLGFDMSKIVANGVTPLFIGDSCSQAAFAVQPDWEPSVRTIADLLLFEPGKGAIGLIGPTWGIYLHGGYWFAQALYPKLRDRDKTIGRAFLEAKTECLESHELEQSTFREYSLLGDPALVLARNYDPELSGISAPNAVDPGEAADLEVFFEDRNHTCCGAGGGFCDEVWSIDWEAELGTVIEDEGWPVVPHTATYHAPEGVSGVYDHVTATVTDKMGLTGQWTEPIYIRHSKPGCPYLFVNDGDSYRRDNNISAWAYSDGPNKESSTDYYKLRIKPYGDEYLLEIRGLERETSFLDRIFLLTVDHGDSTTVAVTRDGSLFPYQRVLAPVAAIDRDGDDRLAAIGTRDGLAFEGTKGDVLVLTLDRGTSGLTASAADAIDGGGGGGLILGGDGKVDPCEDGGCFGDDSFAGGTSGNSAEPISIPKGIVVQIESSDGNWDEIGFMRPREHTSEAVVPLPAFVPTVGAPARVRLLWTGSHSLDYVGYVTRAGEALAIRALEPTTALHSADGSVLEDVARTDDTRTCIPSGETVTLSFTAEPPEEGKERDLVLVTEGYFTREASPEIFMQMSIPTRDMLEPATPNPFRSEIAIHYAIASPGRAVEIAVYDAKGRLVKRLFSGIKPPGRYVATWDGRTGEEKAAPAGVYFCRMTTEERTTSTKIIRTK
jgi:hypothetical protein